MPRVKYSDRLRPITIRPPELRGRLVFAWRAGGPSSPAGRALVRLAAQTLRERTVS